MKESENPTETQKETSLKRIFNRRDFLAAVSAGIVYQGINYVTGRSLDTKPAHLNSSPDGEADKSETSEITPEIISGVKVYGLREKVSTEAQIHGFYFFQDLQFMANHGGETIIDKQNLRKELLPPNERYLEVVVRRSAYNSFVSKEQETGVNFVEWIKMHVDLLNRLLEESKPSTETKVVLRRILVIDDDLPKPFWDEAAYKRGKAKALDEAWTKFNKVLPLDTDMAWAIAEDYRQNPGAYFWKFTHTEGATVFVNRWGDKRVLPEKPDSLEHKNDIWLDLGLIHEWSHVLLNLPDEYAQDLHYKTQFFKRFLIGTGSLHDPYISPYLAYRMRENNRIKARNYHYKDDERLVSCFFERPDEISLQVVFPEVDENESRIEIRNVRNASDSFYKDLKPSLEPDQTSEGLKIRFGSTLLGNKSNCWLLTFNGGAFPRELYLPASIFNMSKIVGLNSADYLIHFTHYFDSTKRVQEIMIMDQSELNSFLFDSAKKGVFPYAKMKVPGTNTWFVWMLRDLFEM